MSFNAVKLLTKRKEFIALEVLARAARPLYGHEVVAASQYRVTRRLVYGILSRLERKGLITCEMKPYTDAEIGYVQHCYQITDEGRRKVGDGAATEDRHTG